VTNRFQGLARGPIDHKSSSVVNRISNGAIDMGSVVILSPTINSKELLPRVEESIDPQTIAVYGIAVGGDTDGIYGDGSVSVDDKTRATNGAGQGVVIVTQGTCLARVRGSLQPMVIGDALGNSSVAGVLEQIGGSDTVIAIALNIVANGDTDMIAVDVQRRAI